MFEAWYSNEPFGMRAVAELQRPDAFGVRTVKVVIYGHDYGSYESTPEQIAKAEADAKVINEALQTVFQREG